jgi:threonine aldolase
MGRLLDGFSAFDDPLTRRVAHCVVAAFEEREVFLIFGGSTAQWLSFFS